MASTRRLVLLGGIAALSLLAAPALANATVFCVPNNAVDASCQTPQADVQSALDAAEANAGNDTVRIGAGTFTAGGIDGFRYEAGNGNVSIIGAGEASTTLTHQPDPGGTFHINNVLFLDGSGVGSTISNLTASIPTPADNTFQSQHRTIEARGVTIDHVTVTAPSVANLNSYGFWVDPGSTTIDNSTVTFPAPGGQDGVITTSGASVQIEDSSITARAGVVLRAAGATNTIKRTTINVVAANTGVDLLEGTIDLESSVIDLGSVGSVGARATGTAAANDALLNLDHATIVGTDAGADGVLVQASDASQDDTMTANITNSVISGPGTAIRRSADQGDTANVTSSYSNYDPSGNVSSNGTNGAGAITETNQTNLAPGFIGGGDFHLTSGSALIDAGDPTSPAPGVLDLDGDAREIFGKDGCGPRRDIGADEFEPVTPPTLLDCIPPDTILDSGPSGAITDNTPTFTFHSSEQPATFQCSVDGGPTLTCTSPLTSVPLSDGPHTLSVQAIDGSSNVDPSPALGSFTVDTTEPDTAIGSHPKPKTKSRKATFTFTSTEAGSTFLCSYDGKTYAACSSPFTTPKLTKGKHRFDVIATDSLGNRDQSAATFLWKVKKRKRHRR